MKELKIINRGFMMHVDYCPIGMREYKGKPYANFIDDCTSCPNFKDRYKLGEDEYIKCEAKDV